MIFESFIWNFVGANNERGDSQRMDSWLLSWDRIIGTFEKRVNKIGFMETKRVNRKSFIESRFLEHQIIGYKEENHSS